MLLLSSSSSLCMATFAGQAAHLMLFTRMYTLCNDTQEVKTVNADGVITLMSTSRLFAADLQTCNWCANMISDMP